MNFVFFDKSKVEMEVITDLLYEENIPYKIKKFITKDYFFNDDDEDNFMIVEELYEIICNTDLEHYDFIKSLANKRIRNRINLEKCYMQKVRKNKNVSRVHKENTTNTNSNDRK